MMRPPSLRVLALLLLPLLAGCDEAGQDDTFTFTVDDVVFTFGPFQGSAIDGDAVELDAQASQNILGSFPTGFGADDVTRVRLKSGSAQIRFINAPAGATIGVLDDASLRLNGGGTSVEVASAENIESGTSMLNEAPLEVLSPSDPDQREVLFSRIAEIVTSGAFGATLDVSGDAGIPDGLYRLEVYFDLDVTVRSL